MATNTGGATPAQYNAAIALDFFRSAGKEVRIDAGERFFAENDKANRLLFQRDKMYLLLQGEVDLTAGGQVVATVRAGEIFGEMASITQAPRSASASARTPCTVIALDDRQFTAALERKPEFALMLLGMMIARLRDTASRIDGTRPLSPERTLDVSSVFESRFLETLQNELVDAPPTHYMMKRPIMAEGQAGVFMYVVLSGVVAISMRGQLVERVGTGGVFGELSLVDQGRRVADVVAETDVDLLAINRKAFLELMQGKPQFGLSVLHAVGDRLRFLTAQLA